MKKTISVLLAVILAFSALAVAVSAEGDYQTYYVAYDISEDTIQVVPLEGYSQYVLPGEDFKFTIETDEDYTDTFIIVEVNTATIEPDVHGVYTIEEITDDCVLKVYLSVEEQQSNIFASLIVLMQNIFSYFVEILNTLFKAEAK